jgi:hypothetical protein
LVDLHNSVILKSRIDNPEIEPPADTDKMSENTIEMEVDDNQTQQEKSIIQKEISLLESQLLILEK